VIEKHWLALRRPEVAVLHIANRVSLRKRLLIGCGYARLRLDALPPSLRKTIAAIEARADGDTNALDRLPRPRVVADAHMQSMLVGGNYAPGDFSVLGALKSRYGIPLTIQILHCVVGNPFRPVAFDPSWRTSTAFALAEGVYADRAFDRLPILADALEDAGCDAAELLAHLRGDGPHARGCWVVDLVLGKA
jgi:hypothetical protein